MLFTDGLYSIATLTPSGQLWILYLSITLKKEALNYIYISNQFFLVSTGYQVITEVTEYLHISSL